MMSGNQSVKRDVLVLLVAVLLTPGYLQGQEEAPKLVSNKSGREATLVKAEALLKLEDREFLARIPDTNNPFELYVEPVTTVDEETGKTVVVEQPKIKAPEPPKISDETVLRSVAKSLKPRGSLVTSRKSLLLLANGRSLSEGDAISVKVRGEPFSVVVKEITTKYYTLTLNEAEVTMYFTDITKGGKARFDSKG